MFFQCPTEGLSEFLPLSPKQGLHILTDQLLKNNVFRVVSEIFILKSRGAQILGMEILGIKNSRTPTTPTTTATGTGDDWRQEGKTRDQGGGGAMSATQPPPPPLPPPPPPQALTRDVATGSGPGRRTGE